MRALTGIGGGGLMTMATIINSDIIPFQERGMYQACQNVLHGFGSICGASLGGLIADKIGWRWCFLCQVPVSIFAHLVGYAKIVNPETSKLQSTDDEVIAHKSIWEKIDISGAIVLVLGLSVQLAALSLGGNEYAWSDSRVVLALVVSAILLFIFVLVELRCKALAVMPMYMLKGRLAVSSMVSNVGVGMAAYSVCKINFKQTKLFADSA